jgi:Lamin Tail Domain
VAAPAPGPVAAGEVLIVAALPDPAGTDRGHELITLLNTTAADIDLTGWELADAAGGRQQLSGPLAAGGVVQVTASGALQLGNQGDTIILVDPNRSSVDQVSYKADRVRSGRTICFGR